MKKLTKEQRRSYVSSQARKLAKSGDHDDYMSIEFQLCTDGYPEARTVLDNRTTRKELNDICDRVRRRKGLPVKQHLGS